jgi:hypothetical protein
LKTTWYVIFKDNLDNLGQLRTTFSFFFYDKQGVRRRGCVVG